MKQSTALWITNRTKELGRPFAIIVQTARCQVSSSTRPQYEQRTWILFSGKCEKKSAGNQLQTVPDWGTGILVLSVAAYTCASEPGPQTGKFPKGRFLPPTGPAHPTNVVAGRVPSRFAAPRLSNGRQHLPHSRSFLMPDTHSLPSVDNRSSVPWCTTA